MTGTIYKTVTSLRDEVKLLESRAVTKAKIVSNEKMLVTDGAFLVNATQRAMILSILSTDRSNCDKSIIRQWLLTHAIGSKLVLRILIEEL